MRLKTCTSGPVCDCLELADCVRKVVYTVKDVHSDNITLTDGQQLDLQRASRCLHLSYAITYASVQGLTLQGVVRLHTRGHFTLRHLYVGSSRATAAELLEVVRPEY